MSKTLTVFADRVGSEQVLASARETARQMWLFGLGAYSLATRSSAQAFATLVREGKAFSPKARRQIAEKSAELKSGAKTTIERGEQLFRERFVRPLDYLAPASRRDVDELSMRVRQLATEVQRLTGSAAKPPVSSEPMIETAATDSSQVVETAA